MFRVHRPGASRDDARRKAVELMDRVKIPSARQRVQSYPHEFSGGMSQRVMIAMAIALEPDILIADEPTTALDVSIQAQVVNLLEEIQDEFGLSYIFIAHDLSIVRHISDRVAVMYLGKFVELGTWQEIYERPTHPYTQALLSAVPAIDPAERTRRVILEGEMPSPIDPPSGRRFRTRCQKAEARCAAEEPALVERAGGHASACHFAAPPVR